MYVCKHKDAVYSFTAKCPGWVETPTVMRVQTKAVLARRLPPGDTPATFTSRMRDNHSTLPRLSPHLTQFIHSSPNHHILPSLRPALLFLRTQTFQAPPPISSFAIF